MKVDPRIRSKGSMRPVLLSVEGVPTPTMVELLRVWRGRESLEVTRVEFVWRETRWQLRVRRRCWRPPFGWCLDGALRRVDGTSGATRAA